MRKTQTKEHSNQSKEHSFHLPRSLTDLGGRGFEEQLMTRDYNSEGREDYSALRFNSVRYAATESSSAEAIRRDLNTSRSI